DLPAVEWDVSAEMVCYHLGRPPQRDYVPPASIAGGMDLGTAWKHPLEDPDDGCPGGDQRCRFVGSLSRYMRSMDERGGRVTNPLLDRCSDWLVVEAILEYEAYQDAASAARSKHNLEVERQQATK